MPVSAFEIMMGKVWANALVLTAVISASLFFVLKGLLGQPIAGSIPLLIGGIVTYLFSATSIGIFLATIARSMPQLGLIAMMVAVPMNMLAGTSTPLESQPQVLQAIMHLSPSTHFVSFAQAVIFRGATLGDVWPEIAMMAAIGLAIFAAALARFRRSMAAAQGG
jgi:ABC-2 type transport system permease protein